VQYVNSQTTNFQCQLVALAAGVVAQLRFKNDNYAAEKKVHNDYAIIYTLRHLTTKSSITVTGKQIGLKIIKAILSTLGLYAENTRVNENVRKT